MAKYYASPQAAPPSRYQLILGRLSPPLPYRLAVVLSGLASVILFVASLPFIVVAVGLRGIVGAISGICRAVVARLERAGAWLWTALDHRPPHLDPSHEAFWRKDQIARRFRESKYQGIKTWAQDVDDDQPWLLVPESEWEPRKYSQKCFSVRATKLRLLLSATGGREGLWALHHDYHVLTDSLIERILSELRYHDTIVPFPTCPDPHPGDRRRRH